MFYFKEIFLYQSLIKVILDKQNKNSFILCFNSNDFIVITHQYSFSMFTILLFNKDLIPIGYQMLGKEIYLKENNLK